jgi:ribose 1,5-bisphosphokinase
MSGRLVLVAGPSGAGKDTVLNYAKARLAGDPGFVFSRRVITRPADASEDHEPVTEAEFFRRRFALSWQAHGLHYGIPAGIETDLAAGRTVIANVSRGVIAGARQNHRCLVIEITAPPAVLAARLAARQREAAADIAARLARNPAEAGADITIMNDASPEAAGDAFVAALKIGP